MLKKIGQSMTSVLQRWMPEPFVFAILLTLLVTVLALVYTDAGIGGVADGWYKGFWLLLEFGMQIVLYLSYRLPTRLHCHPSSRDLLIGWHSEYIHHRRFIFWSCSWCALQFD